MANKDQVAKLKQRNITLAGENVTLRQQLDRAYGEIEHLHAKLRFIAKDCGIIAKPLPLSSDPAPDDGGNPGDGLLELILQEARNAR